MTIEEMKEEKKKLEQKIFNDIVDSPLYRLGRINMEVSIIQSDPLIPFHARKIESVEITANIIGAS